MKRRHSWFITMVVLGLLVVASGSAAAQTRMAKSSIATTARFVTTKGHRRANTLQ